MLSERNLTIDRNSLRDRVAGLVIAGGASRRMGEDKAFVSFGGRPLIDHCTEALSLFARVIAISSNAPREKFGSRAETILGDRIDPLTEGPISGVFAGLDWAAKILPPVNWLLTIPIDSPSLPDAFGERLVAQAEANFAAASAVDTGGFLEPTHAVYRLSRAGDALAFARRNPRAGLYQLLNALGAVPVTFPGHHFLNLNSPADLQRAGKLPG